MSDPSFLAQIAQKFRKKHFRSLLSPEQVCYYLCSKPATQVCLQRSKFPLLAAEYCGTRLLSGGKEILIAARIFIGWTAVHNVSLWGRCLREIIRVSLHEGQIVQFQSHVTREPPTKACHTF